jgi:hypothetical protein
MSQERQKGGGRGEREKEREREEERREHGRIEMVFYVIRSLLNLWRRPL